MQCFQAIDNRNVFIECDQFLKVEKCASFAWQWDFVAKYSIASASAVRFDNYYLVEVSGVQNRA